MSEEYVNLNQRLQSSLGKQVVRNTQSNSRISRLTLGRVTKVYHSNNSVDFTDMYTGASYSHSSDLNGQSSARLPVSFSGQNGYGKPYGAINPVNTGDYIIVGFLNEDGKTPIVLSIVGNDAVMEQLSRDPDNSTDNDSPNDQGTIGQQFVVYPDQTYKSKDGLGNEVLSFNGKTFLMLQSDNVDLQDPMDDTLEGPGYNNLDTSYFSDNTEIEPINSKAPSILLKHQGILDKNNNTDTHETLLAVNQNGDARVSAMDKNEDYRGSIELNHDGTSQLRYQPTSKLRNSDNGDEIYLQVGKDGITISAGSGDPFSLTSDGLTIGTGDDAIDIKKSIINQQNQQKTTLEQIETLSKGYNDTQTSINQLTDKIELSATETISKNDTIYTLYGNDATATNLFSLTMSTSGSRISSTDGSLITDSTGVTSASMAVGGEDDYYVSAYGVSNGTTLAWAEYDSNNNFIDYSYLTADKDNMDLSQHILTSKDTSYIKVSISVSQNVTTTTTTSSSGDNTSSSTTSSIYLVKFAKTDSLTSWTPAPQDMIANVSILSLLIEKAKSYQDTINSETSTMNSDIVSLQNTISSINTGAISNSQLSSIKTGVNTLEGTYAEMYQEATRSGNDTSALKTAYLNLNSYLATVSSSLSYSSTSMNSAINSYQSAFGDLASATKDSYATIETTLQGTLTSLTSTSVGGVNFALETGTAVSVTTSGTLYNLSSNIGNLIEPVTLSFKYTLSSLEQITIADDTGDNSYLWEPTTLTGSFTYTFENWKTISGNDHTLTIKMPTNTKITISYLMLEHGNTPSSWSAAPEDTQNYIDTKFSDFKVTPDMISSTVMETITQNVLDSDEINTMNTNIQQNASKITETSTKIDTEVSAINTDLSNNYVTNSAAAATYSTKSEMEQTATSITDTVSATYTTKDETSSANSATLSSANSHADSAASAAGATALSSANIHANSAASAAGATALSSANSYTDSAASATLASAESKIEQTANSITAEVSGTYLTKDDATNTYVTESQITTGFTITDKKISLFGQELEITGDMIVSGGPYSNTQVDSGKGYLASENWTIDNQSFQYTSDNTPLPPNYLNFSQFNAGGYAYDQSLGTDSITEAGNHTYVIDTDDYPSSAPKNLYIGSLKITSTGAGSTSNYVGLDYTSQGSFSSGSTTTVSFYAKSISGNTSITTSDKTSHTFTATTSWAKYSASITATDSAGVLKLYLGGTGVLLISMIKYESGSTATAWVPAQDRAYNSTMSSSISPFLGVILENKNTVSSTDEFTITTQVSPLGTISINSEETANNVKNFSYLNIGASSLDMRDVTGAALNIVPEDLYFWGSSLPEPIDITAADMAYYGTFVDEIAQKNGNDLSTGSSFRDFLFHGHLHVNLIPHSVKFDTWQRSSGSGDFGSGTYDAFGTPSAWLGSGNSIAWVDSLSPLNQTNNPFYFSIYEASWSGNNNGWYCFVQFYDSSGNLVQTATLTTPTETSGHAYKYYEWSGMTTTSADISHIHFNVASGPNNTSMSFKMPQMSIGNIPQPWVPRWDD